jgi:hypothetical protein
MHCLRRERQTTRWPYLPDGGSGQVRSGNTHTHRESYCHLCSSGGWSQSGNRVSAPGAVVMPTVRQHKPVGATISRSRLSVESAAAPPPPASAHAGQQAVGHCVTTTVIHKNNIAASPVPHPRGGVPVSNRRSVSLTLPEGAVTTPTNTTAGAPDAPRSRVLSCTSRLASAVGDVIAGLRTRPRGLATALREFKSRLLPHQASAPNVSFAAPDTTVNQGEDEDQGGTATCCYISISLSYPPVARLPAPLHSAGVPPPVGFWGQVGM